MKCNATLTVCTTTDDVLDRTTHGLSGHWSDVVPDGVAVVRDGDRLMRLDVTTLTCERNPRSKVCKQGRGHRAGSVMWDDDTPGAASHADVLREYNTPPTDPCRKPYLHVDWCDCNSTPPADVRCRPCSMGHPNECEHPERVCPMEPPADDDTSYCECGESTMDSNFRCLACGKDRLPADVPTARQNVCPDCGGKGGGPFAYDDGACSSCGAGKRHYTDGLPTTHPRDFIYYGADDQRAVTDKQVEAAVTALWDEVGPVQTMDDAVEGVSNAMRAAIQAALDVR